MRCLIRLTGVLLLFLSLPFFAPLHARKKAEKTPPPCFPSLFPFAWLLLSAAKPSGQGEERVLLLVVDDDVIIRGDEFQISYVHFLRCE